MTENEKSASKDLTSLTDMAGSEPGTLSGIPGLQQQQPDESPLDPVPGAAELPAASPTTSDDPMEPVKQFAEQLPPGNEVAYATFPFSLMITGKLTDLEKDKLIGVISSNQMGISELDLEPQLASGKVLIPRISEYAGVLIVQALRGTRAGLRLGPSDTIYATAETRDDPRPMDACEPAPGGPDEYDTDDGIVHPAESLPVTQEARLPGLPHCAVIDVITASAVLKTRQVEAESSAEYQEILEALQRELKYKAYRKGAQGIVSFSVQLTRLIQPTHYKMTAMGTAIRTA